jgi:hypothetical protein
MSHSNFSDSSPNPYQSPPSSGDGLRGDLDLSSSSTIVLLLSQTRPWVRFLSILGFLASALMLGAGCVVAAILMARGRPLEATMGLGYVVGAILYIVPSLYLYRYADRIRDLETGKTPEALASALAAQKSFWRFVGIAMALVLVAYAVILVIGIVIGIAAAFVG